MKGAAMAFGLPHLSFIGYPTPIPCAGHARLGLREAGRADLPAILAHYVRLDPSDRRLRFCAAMSDAALEEHVAALRSRAEVVIVAFDGPLWPGPFHAPGAIRAMAELAIDGKDAEIGFSVDAVLRRRGVGTALVQTAGRLLAPRGVARLHAYTAPGNAALLRLGRRSGAEIDVCGAEAEIVFPVGRLHRDYLRRRMASQAFLAAG
jgi:GNAT superfamily N-acetyltransferase